MVWPWKMIGSWLTFGLILLLAAYLRLVDIEARPLHSDESVNFLFIEGLFRDGIYPYSHENYHGPLYFYLMGLGITLFGDGVLGLRMAAIVSGILTLLPLLLLRKTISWSFVLVAGLLISISPSLVFHSRYAIHESLLLTASLWFAVSAFNAWTRFDRLSLVSLGAALGLMIATKETWIICCASIGFGLLLLGHPFQRLQKVLGMRHSIFAGFLLCLLIVIVNFTNGFQTGGGIRELLLAIPQWVNRGESDVGHFKPFPYYLERLILAGEPQLLIGLLASLFLLDPFLIGPALLRRGENIQVRLGFVRFLFGWAIATILIYSAISYKTPWLIINLTLPPTLLLAILFSELLESRLLLGRILGVLLLIVTAIASFRKTSEWCYSKAILLPDSLLRIEAHTPFGEANPYSYVHTSSGTLTLVKDIFEYWRSHPNARVLVGVNGYFPLPYYLRANADKLAYLKTDKPETWKTQYDVIVVDQTVQFPDPEWEKRYYRLSDYAETNTYFRKYPEKHL